MVTSTESVQTHLYKERGGRGLRAGQTGLSAARTAEVWGAGMSA